MAPRRAPIVLVKSAGGFRGAYEAFASLIIEMDTPGGKIVTGVKKLGAFIGDDVVIDARNILAPGTRIKSNSVAKNLITLKSIL